MSKDVSGEQVREVLDGVAELLLALKDWRNGLDANPNSLGEDEVREFIEKIRLKFGVAEFTEEQVQRLVRLLRNASPRQMENLPKHLVVFRNRKNALTARLN